MLTNKTKSLVLTYSPHEDASLWIGSLRAAFRFYGRLRIKHKTFNVVCYVDGFNLYHAIDDLHRAELKRVNLWALAESLLRKNEQLVAVEYFSAFATWKPHRYRRHQKYVAALQSVGVTTNMAHFKDNVVKCRSCNNTWVNHEEKETDVHIALKILENAVDDIFHRAMIISADSDLVPVVKMVKSRWPQKQILIVAPPQRYKTARDLIRSANNSAVQLTAGRIEQNIFDETIMPHEWK